MDEQFAKDMEEYVQSLSELKRALHQLHLQTRNTHDAMKKLLGSTHLQAVLTMSKEDKFLKKIAI